MLLLLLACTADPTTPFVAEDRADGDRTPLAAGCDPIDAARCWLPWPSSAETVADPDTVTGLRVEVDDASLPVDDDPRWIELADGFSRLSPVLTIVDGVVDAAPAPGAVRLFVAWQDGAASAMEIPAWSEAVVEGERSLLVGYPDAVLPADADIVVVVTDQLRLADGSAPTNDHLDRVSLGLDAPASDDEASLRAWYAPVRRVLDDAAIDPAGVYRAWSFTTRSADDPGKRLATMFADVDAATLSVAVSGVEVYGDADPIAMVVSGTVEGVPAYRPGDGEWLTLDDDGRPTVLTTHGAPFRVVVPRGTGDYPVVLYGHGTGGDVTDDTFDSEIAQHGIAKAGMQFWGWNGDELVEELAGFSDVFDASSRSTSALLQSLADGHAIVKALQGPLADALAADTIAGGTNPAAGRRPDGRAPMWVGGSLGGTLGAVMVAADPAIRFGVLDVPAGAWTHLIPEASLYSLLVEQITHAWYPSDLDARAAIAMSQNAWDDVDGAAWEDPDSVLLLQESIGDPVVPNVGTAMLARARGAALVGGPLDDMLLTLEQTDGVTDRTGITQYQTPYTDDYDIHGFAAKDGAVGDAAREQIETFLMSWRDGQAVEVVLPAACVASGVCDFGE